MISRRRCFPRRRKRSGSLYGPPLFRPPIFPNIWLQRAGSREKIAAFLKPCDTYSFQQLCKEHRVQRAVVYAVAVQCEGMCDMEQLQAQAKAPLAVRGRGRNPGGGDPLRRETLTPADGVGRAVPQLQNQKDGLL